MITQNRSRFDESLQAYDKAIELAPANDTRNLSSAYKGKAVALSHMGEDLADKGLKEESRARLEEAVKNYDKVIELDVDYDSLEAQLNRAGVLEELGLHNESVIGYEKALEQWNRSLKGNPGGSGILTEMAVIFMELGRYEAAIAVLNNATQIMPKDVEAWWLKAESLDSLGQNEAALEAYDKVTDLDTTKAIGAWIRMADILLTLGRYNDSLDAFDGALNLLPAVDKQSRIMLWWKNDTAIYHNAWLADGQILRTCSAWYNCSCGDFENIIVVNSDFVAAWQRRGGTISPQGGHSEALVSRDSNWDTIWLPKCCGDAYRGCLDEKKGNGSEERFRFASACSSKHCALGREDFAGCPMLAREPLKDGSYEKPMRLWSER